MPAPSLLTQALDMLIVQANTNTIASHFVGLLASLRIQGAADTTTAISAARRLRSQVVLCWRNRSVVLYFGGGCRFTGFASPWARALQHGLSLRGALSSPSSSLAASSLDVSMLRVNETVL